MDTNSSEASTKSRSSFMPSLRAVVQFLKRAAAKQFFITGVERYNYRRFQGAVRAFSRSIALDPSQPRAFLYRATAFRYLGQLERSFEDYSEMIALDARSSATYLARGTIHNYYGRFEDAIRDFEQCLLIEPKNADAMSELSMACSNSGKLEQAMEIANRAIAADPRLGKAYAVRAWIHGAQNDTEKMLFDSNTAIELDPTYAGGFIARGLARVQVKQCQAAHSDLDRAVQLAPTCFDAIAYRGMMKVHLKEYHAAISDCDEAIRRDPRHAFAYRIRGFAYRRLNELERAMSDYDESLRIVRSCSTVVERAQLYMDCGKREFREQREAQAAEWYQKARFELEHAIEMDSKDWTAHNGLAWLLATCALRSFRDSSKAVEYATTACALTQWKEPECLDTLAVVYAECGDFESAIRNEASASDRLNAQNADHAQRQRFHDRLKLFEERKTVADSGSLD